MADLTSDKRRPIEDDALPRCDQCRGLTEGAEPTHDLEDAESIVDQSYRTVEPAPGVVNVDRLGSTDDGYRDTTLDGKFYSGIAFEEDEDTKTIIGVSGYRFGKLHGPLRSWDPSGRPKLEVYHNGGGLQGPWREWHENGRPRLDSYYEHGFLLRKKQWNERGDLLSEEHLDEKHPRWSKLQEARARSGDKVVDIDQDRWEFFERPQGWGREEADIPPPPPPPRHR